jgi:hypothetical protein
MARCNCDSQCSCLIVGGTTECIDNTVTGTGTAANPYVITSEFTCATADSLNPATRLTKSADQPIADNTVTAVTWDQETYDNDVMHDNVTNNSRITIKTAGVYVVSFAGRFPGRADYSYVMAKFRVNGAGFHAEQAGYLGGVGFQVSMSTTMQYKFAVNDYVEAYVYQDNTAPASSNLLAADANGASVFSAVWVSAG